MTCQRDFFWNFQDWQLSSIFLAENTKHTPYGKGTVNFFSLSLEKKLFKMYRMYQPLRKIFYL